MIFSKDHNFLLLKNGKVGGTALEFSLSPVLPKNAIVTPATGNSPEWKIINEELPLDYNPRNYENFFNHISYSEIERKIDLKDVKSYIFVRNPYEIVLSHFFHRLYFLNKNLIWNELDKKEQKQLLDKYFNNELQTKWHTSTKYLYLSKNNEIQITEFLFYEKNINFEINKILKKHNIPLIEINIKSKNFKPKEITYKDVFYDDHLEIIYNNWNWEFKYFNYEK